MAKSMDDSLASMIRNLEEKTGKSLPQWVELARKSGKSRHGEIVSLLKTDHGLGHGYANLIAQRALEPQDGSVPSGGDLVEAQYSGAKAPLRPIYEALLARIGKFGADVEVAPKKSYVSLRGSKQFALIQPSTATRIDVGINLKGVPPSGRLEASGSFNAMVTHRVRIARIEEVDKELEGWLRQAYLAS